MRNLKEKKRKLKRISHDATTGKSLPYSSGGKDSTNETNYNETSHDSLSQNFDNNDSFQKFIFDKLNKMQEQYNSMQNELESTKDELQKEKEKRKEADYELFKVKLDNTRLKDSDEKMERQIKNLQLDMKIIKVQTVYKAIIDIFAKVFGLNLLDSYKVKKDNIIDQFELFGQNEKVKDLQDFLSDILYYIYEGNNLAHFISKDKLPLDFVFDVLQEDCKLNYSSIKPILQKLSFNKTLKYAYGSYFYQDDYDKLLEKIEFSKEDSRKNLL